MKMRKIKGLIKRDARTNTANSVLVFTTKILYNFRLWKIFYIFWFKFFVK